MKVRLLSERGQIEAPCAYIEKLADIGRQEIFMRKLPRIVFTIISITIISCLSRKIMERVGLIELERKGFAIHLDSSPINLGMTYLNEQISQR